MGDVIQLTDRIRREKNPQIYSSLPEGFENIGHFLSYLGKLNQGKTFSANILLARKLYEMAGYSSLPEISSPNEIMPIPKKKMTDIIIKIRRRSLIGLVKS